MYSKLSFCFSLLLVGALLPPIDNNPSQQAVNEKSSRVAHRPNILFVIMDDWGWPHAGAYGDKVVKTPAFDRLAKAGVLFTNAYCVSPSCTPSRGAVLTGQTIHRLEEGGNLWSILPGKFKVYPDALEEIGYQVGYTGKGWGPGALNGSGRSRNPAGPEYNQATLQPPNPLISAGDYKANFAAFMKGKPKDTPFCFWFGSLEPHRKYEKGMGIAQGKNPQTVQVPAFLPDTPEIRSDLLDYYAEIEYADRHLGQMIKLLEDSGELANTLIVVTGDNGMPFPRAKANLYDAGTHLPLAIHWPARIKGGWVVQEFVSFTDFAPTFLEAAGLKPSQDISGKSLLPLLEGRTTKHREYVFVERERHANVRQGSLGYPCRGIRTHDFLYIRNFHPERWPAGDPDKFGDVDDSPTKQFMLAQRNDKAIEKYFRLAFDQRPAEELYDVRQDPAQVNNLADAARYSSIKQKLRGQLSQWMQETGDPRANQGKGPWDDYPYFKDPAPEVKK